MDRKEFQESLRHPKDNQPPAGLSEPLRALWLDRRGEWEKAHQIVQNAGTPEAAWVHAYLHRKEGDLGNARYWYNRAGREESKKDLDGEWEEIVQGLLA